MKTCLPLLITSSSSSPPFTHKAALLKQNYGIRSLTPAAGRLPKAWLRVADEAKKGDLIFEREALRARGKSEDECIDGAVERVKGKRKTAVRKTEAHEEEERPGGPLSSLCDDAKGD